MSTAQSAPQVNSFPFSKPQSDILTVEQAAQFLSMTKRQIWEMTRARGQARMPIPIPHLRVNGNIRFKCSSLEQWVNDLETYQRTGQLPTARMQ